MNDFLYGAITLAGWAIGLRLLKFWRVSRERLFLLFALAFWALAADWLLLELFHPPDEVRFFLYLLRLLAFLLIVLAIVDKNLESRRR